MVFLGRSNIPTNSDWWTTPYSFGCNTTDYDNTVTKDKIVLVRRGGCTFSNKTLLAYYQEAVGIIVVNDESYGYDNVIMNIGSTLTEVEAITVSASVRNILDI